MTVDWGIVADVLWWCLIGVLSVCTLILTGLWATLIIPDRWIPERIKYGKGGDPLGMSSRTEDPSAKKLKKYAAEPSKNEVVLGWRGYSIDREAENSYLLRGMAGNEWPSRTLKADCCGNENRGEIHLAEGRCTCGIYGLKEEHASQLQYSDVRALCAFWGWIVPAEYGFRAQYARIEKLFFTCRCTHTQAQCPCESRFQQIAKHYGVPYEVKRVEIKRLVVPQIDLIDSRYSSLQNFLPVGALALRVTELPGTRSFEILYEEV